MGAFLLGITGSIAARVMTSLGIGIFSYAAISTLIDAVNAAAVANFNSMADVPVAIVNLAGGGQAVSIICAAFVTKGALMAIKSMRPI